ncbi:MAG TPA: hypothetical protein VG406_25940 [Isosphaeraceae bacterium]|jgi:hypothetical protein|nr:hypothetical protein [Isosphaeraceae bacterium]
MATGEGVPGDRELARIPFSVEAEGHIRGLAVWLSVVGWLNIVAAAANFVILLAPMRNAGHLFDVVIHALIGAWSLQAARAFQGLATTDTADQAYLVEGFAKLRRIFLLQGILVLVGLAFLVAVLLFLLLHGLPATR